MKGPGSNRQRAVPKAPLLLPPLTLPALTAACLLLLASSCSRTDGVYLREGIKGDSLTLHKDGRFSLRESGQVISGTYKIDGETILLITERGEERTGQMQAGALEDPHGNRWVKK